MTGPEAARLALVAETMQSAARVLAALAAGPGATAIVHAGELLVRVLAGGGQVLVFGNGGSAADAQHFAAELVGRFVRRRRGFPAVALSTDTSVLTSVANDFGFESVFARQVEALGRPGDLAVGITTSGASPNVVRALEAAKARGLQTIALTGNDGGAAGRIAGVHVNVPETNTARVQEAHITVLHLLCAFVDREVEG